MSFARFVSVAFSTPVLALLLLLSCGWVGGAPLAGLTAAVFLVGGPAVAIWVGIRQGALQDRFVSDRRKRLPLAVVSTAAGLLALAVLTLISAPAEVFVGTIAIVLAVVVVGTVSYWWKISAHSTLAALVTIAVWAWSPWGVLLVSLVVVVGASRVVLGAHSLPQTITGALIGAAIGWLCFVVW